jgi:hypothetical protein
LPLYGLGLDVAQSLRQSGDPFVCGRMRVRTQETNGPQLPRLLRTRIDRPRRRAAEQREDSRRFN